MATNKTKVGKKGSAKTELGRTPLTPATQDPSVLRENAPLNAAVIVRPDADGVETTTTTTTRKAAPAKAEKTMTMTVLHVNIVRDPMVKIAAEIFEHELPILEALNGPDNVEVISEEDVEVANFNVVDEYDRLRRKYRKLDQGAAIDALGRTPATLAKRLGIAYDRDAVQRRGQRSQALIRDGGKTTSASAPARATRTRSA